MADRVRDRRALSLLYLSFLITDGAGQAGVEEALLVRVGVVQTLLTHSVMVVFAVCVHTLPHWAHRARLALARYDVKEIVVVTDADGVIQVSAGRLHPHQADALSAGSALLCVTVVL